MNIDLNRIYISAFRDIGVDQVVDIPTKTLVGVGGKNEDSGGSNGSGKTTFIMSDKVAMFGPKFVDLTAQDCKNRHLDETTKLACDVTVGGKRGTISRTIGGKLTLSIEGEVKEGKVEDMQPRIESFLSIPPEYLSYLTYKAQGDYGGFIKMKDADKKQFLSQFFNLERIEKAGTKVDERLKSNSSSLVETKAKLDALRENVQLIEQDLKNTTDILESQDFKDKVTKLKSDKEKLEAAQYQLINARSAVSNYRPPEPPNDMVTRQNYHSSRYNSMVSAIQKSEKASSDLSWIATQLVEVKSKLGHAKEGRCHACGQSVKSADADQIMSANLKKMEDLAAKANLLKADVVDVEALKKERDSANEEYRKVSEEIQAFKANNNLSQLRSQESVASVTVSSLKNSVDSDERYINHLEHELRNAKSKNEKAMADFSSLESKIASLSKEKEILEQSSKILSRSGFLGYVFDSVLDEINYESNLNIQMIPNIRHLRIYFSPDRAIKTTGATSKEITCSIYDGSNVVSFKTLSGGEGRSISIAVDEAIDTILQRRLGVNVGWKFLDEPFDAIDNNSKEALLEFFRLKSASKTYLIVDHSSEFNAAVDKRITITKRNGIATIDV